MRSGIIVIESASELFYLFFETHSVCFRFMIFYLFYFYRIKMTAGHSGLLYEEYLHKI